MTSFNHLPIFFLALFLVVFYDSFALAEADQTNMPQDTLAERLWPTNGTPMAALIDLTSEYSKGSLAGFKGEARAPLRGDATLDGSIDFSKKYFGERTTFTVFEGGETRWSLAPLSDKLSLNPMTDIRNLEVFLQYKF